MDTPEETACKIVGKLFVPDDPARWGESPVSVGELERMIATAIREALETAAEIADAHDNESACTEACLYAGERENCPENIAREIRALAVARATS